MEDRWDGKKQFRLGKTLSEAYRTWSERMEDHDEIRTVAQILDRFSLEVVPAKAAKTRTEYIRAISRLRPVFGHMHPGDIKPRHAYQYADKRGAPVAAKREIEVLRSALSSAVRWGVIDRNPLLGTVRLDGPAQRTRLVEDWEIVEALSLESRRKKGSVRMVQAYIRLKLLTSLRRGDMLRLTTDALKEDGIHVLIHKTGRRVIYEWTDELRAAVQAALDARPVDIAPWLFCNRRGHCYVDEETGQANGWDSIWQRFMARLLAETEITERFTENDLRRKCANDAESLARARELLAHLDESTTRRFYRFRPERVKPLR